MLGTTMPKASIHKDRNFVLREREVRLAKNRQMPAPSSYPILPKQAGHYNFRVLVPTAADARHNR